MVFSCGVVLEDVSIFVSILASVVRGHDMRVCFWVRGVRGGGAGPMITSLFNELARNIT